MSASITFTASATDRVAEPRVTTRREEAPVFESVARGIRRGWYRALFDLGPTAAAEFAESVGIAPSAAADWFDHQMDAGVLRVVDVDEGGAPVVLLPGEHVTTLLDDHGDPELSGARRMASEHRDRIAPVVRAIAAFAPGAASAWAAGLAGRRA